MDGKWQYVNYQGGGLVPVRPMNMEQQERFDLWYETQTRGNQPVEKEETAGWFQSILSTISSKVMTTKRLHLSEKELDQRFKMRRRYGRSKQLFARRRRRKRPRRRNKTYKKRKTMGPRRAKMVARSIEPYLGETKLKNMGEAITIVPVNLDNTGQSAASILDVSRFNAISAGTGADQRIGDEITLKNINLFFSVSVTKTTYTLHPMRLLIIKSWTKSSTLTAAEMTNIVNNELYLSFPIKPGFGKIINDILIPPLLPMENEFNQESTMSRSFKVKIPINRNIRIDPRDATSLSCANIYAIILRSPYLPGTNTAVPVITMQLMYYWKDA